MSRPTVHQKKAARSTPRDQTATTAQNSPFVVLLGKLRRFWVESVRAIAWIALDSIIAGFPMQNRCAGGVCIVRLDAIGDFILWLESAKRLRTHFSGKGMKLTLVANATWAAWARELDLADEIWALDPLRFNKDWNYRASWVRRARSAGFSTVIQPTYSRWTTAGDSFVRVTHAAVRIGSVGDNSNTLSWLKKWADAWYTQLIPHGGEDCMELVRNAHFMRGIGFSDFRARVPHLPVDAANLSAFQLPCPYAVLVPGGSWSGKAWPVTSFTEIGRRLLVSGLQLVIVGGAPDRRCTDELLHELDGKAINLTGRTSLAALAAILHHAQIVVSNDTGSAHIAAAVGASVVCILGGGHYGRFLPYQIEESFDKRPLPIAVSKTLACFGCNWTCIYNVEVNQPVKCIKEIMVEDVWQQIRMKLSLKAQSVETFTSTAGV